MQTATPAPGSCSLLTSAQHTSYVHRSTICTEPRLGGQLSEEAVMGLEQEGSGSFFFGKKEREIKENGKAKKKQREEEDVRV